MKTPDRNGAGARDQADLLREEIVLLVERCPSGAGAPPACPLRELRAMDVFAVIDWIDALEPDDLEYLVKYHQCCHAVHREAPIVARGPQPAAARGNGTKPATGRKSRGPS